MKTLLAAVMLAAVSAAPAPPPTARTVDIVDHVFGLTLPDPYRWMEGQKNAEFQAWLKAQGDYTRARLDALPGLATWQERLKKISGAVRIHRGQQRAGNRMFFIRQSGKDTGILMVRDADGRERVLVDPATLATAEGAAKITTFSPSPDGSLVAVDIDHGGQEVARMQVFDVTTAKPLPDVVGPVWGQFGANWLPDGKAFTYRQVAPEKERTGGDPLQDMRVRLHRLGDSADRDVLLLRAGNGPGASTSFALKSNEFPSITFNPASPWAVAAATGAHPERRICVARGNGALQASVEWRCLADYSDGVHDFAVHGDTLYLVSMHDRPNGRLLAIDLANSEASLKAAREVLAMSNDAVIAGMAAARDALYVRRMANGVDGFLRLDYASNKTTDVELPFAGTARLFEADPMLDGFVFTLEGWTVPSVAYRYEPATAKLHDLKLGTESPADYGAITSTEMEAVSADGTRVPLSIVHRSDVVLDGRNRALVWAYGGYGRSLQPSFYPARLEWVQAGGVLGVAHVRGGGEKGDAWHRAGQGPNKFKGVEDFLACAAELSRLGYTTPERTALEAGSMGGVLVGGAITRGPNKFGAALVGVGILNPVRLLQGINGANQIAEVGDPRTEEGMKALAAMDPYQNIMAGTKYPAVLLAVGLNDSFVSTWETGKFAARLRTSTSSGKPILILTMDDTGHGPDSPDAVAALRASFYTFLDAQLPGR
jgi:prolyl oligopeptidase